MIVWGREGWICLTQTGEEKHFQRDLSAFVDQVVGGCSTSQRKCTVCQRVVPSELSLESPCFYAGGVHISTQSISISCAFLFKPKKTCLTLFFISAISLMLSSSPSLYLTSFQKICVIAHKKYWLWGVHIFKYDTYSYSMKEDLFQTKRFVSDPYSSCDPKDWKSCFLIRFLFVNFVPQNISAKTDINSSVIDVNKTHPK